MGPAGWAAVGRAIVVAIPSALFGGKNSAAAVMARQIEQAILDNKLQEAEALLRDMAYRHEASFDCFIKEYEDELPDDVIEEFQPR